MESVSYPNIEIDQGWNARVAGTRWKVRMIAEAWLESENFAALRAAFPELSPAQIHSALAYYYDHQVEMDAHRARLRQLEAELLEKSDNSPLRQRLLDAKQRAMESGT